MGKRFRQGGGGEIGGCFHYGCVIIFEKSIGKSWDGVTEERLVVFSPPLGCHILSSFSVSDGPQSVSG